MLLSCFADAQDINRSSIGTNIYFIKVVWVYLYTNFKVLHVLFYNKLQLLLM